MSEIAMNDQDWLELYQYRMFRKLEKMQHTERVAFMEDIFGKRWPDVYERIALIYPALNTCAKSGPSESP